MTDVNIDTSLPRLPYLFLLAIHSRFEVSLDRHVPVMKANRNLSKVGSVDSQHTYRQSDAPFLFVLVLEIVTELPNCEAIPGQMQPTDMWLERLHKSNVASSRL